PPAAEVAMCLSTPSQPCEGRGRHLRSAQEAGYALSRTSRERTRRPPLGLQPRYEVASVRLGIEAPVVDCSRNRFPNFRNRFPDLHNWLSDKFRNLLLDDDRLANSCCGTGSGPPPGHQSTSTHFRSRTSLVRSAVRINSSR